MSKIDAYDSVVRLMAESILKKGEESSNPAQHTFYEIKEYILGATRDLMDPDTKVSATRWQAFTLNVSAEAHLIMDARDHFEGEHLYNMARVAGMRFAVFFDTCRK